MRFRSLALRAVSVAAAAAVLVQLIGCSDKKTIIDEDVLSVNSFLPDYSLVKPQAGDVAVAGQVGVAFGGGFYRAVQSVAHYAEHAEDF